MSHENGNLRLKLLTGLAFMSIGAASAEAAPVTHTAATMPTVERISAQSFLQEVSALKSDRGSLVAGAKELSRATGPLANETNFIWLGLVL